MRAIGITLYVNDGTPTLSTTQSLDAKIADLGSLSWSYDDQLTKLTPGDLTLTVWDEDEAVWNWLDTQIGTTGTGPQLYPPWIVVTLAGTTVFTGLLDIASIERDFRERKVQFSAKDWSSMIRDLVLEGKSWERPAPKTPISRSVAGPWNGTKRTTDTDWTVSFLTWGLHDTIESEIQVGDVVTVTGGALTNQPMTCSWVARNGRALSMSFEGGPSAAAGVYAFTRSTAVLGDQPTYTVMLAATEKDHFFRLNTLDNLLPGDVLLTASNTEITVDDLDTDRMEVICTGEIGTKLAPADVLRLTQDSKETLIWQDAVTLIAKALAPYKIDTTRLALPVAPVPVFAWLPLAIDGAVLRGPADMDTTTDRVRIIGSNNAFYTGSPDLGWTSGTVTARYIDWTQQTTVAPTYLMQDRSPLIAPKIGQRNRVYRDFKPVRPVTRTIADQPEDYPTYDAARIFPETYVFYDYSQLRELTFSNPDNAGFTTMTEKRWNGTAWSAGSTVDWPLTDWRILYAVPMIGTPATTGPVAPQGLAILACVYNVTTKAVEYQLAYAGTIQRLTDSTGFGGVLKTTPWGVWVVGPHNYGRITTNGSALAITWGEVGGQGAYLMPSTFSAVDGNGVFCFAQIDGVDGDGKSFAETHLFHLAMSPTESANPVLRSEKITNGYPRLAMMLRDPSVSARLIGLFGGRLFQVSATLPTTIERIRPTGMSGAELVEFVAQAINAQVVPLPTGYVQLVGRAQPTGTPTALSVDRVKITQRRISENFFSVVRVSGMPQDVYQDAYGATAGGTALEISNQPCIWSDGGAFALASIYAAFFGYPRRKELHTWFHDNAATAPPWEALNPWSVITVNGSTKNWLYIGLSYDLIKGEAEVTLLEQV